MKGLLLACITLNVILKLTVLRLSLYHTLNAANVFHAICAAVAEHVSFIISLVPSNSLA